MQCHRFDRNLVHTHLLRSAVRPDTDRRDGCTLTAAQPTDSCWCASGPPALPSTGGFSENVLETIGGARHESVEHAHQRRENR